MGKVIGIIAIIVKESSFSDIYKKIDIGEGADVFIMEKSGKINSSRYLKKISFVSYLTNFHISTISMIISDIGTTS